MLRLLTFAAAVLFGLSSAHAATLDDVKKKGFVSCGVNVGLGKDDTLFAKIAGTVEFRDRGQMGKFVNITALAE